METTPVQLHAILFPSGDPARRGISSYLRARWVFMTFCESHASQVPFHAVWHMPAAGWSANRDIAAARRSWERAPEPSLTPYRLACYQTGCGTMRI